jgi:DNA-binding MarR family transcriptional regulator
MEIFLMTVISRAGLNTLYRLQREANLQPGSVRQAIRDLEDMGLIARSEAPRRGRNRRTMSLTPIGERFLELHWMDSLEPKQDMESVIRGVTVTILLNGPRTAFKFLNEAAGVREHANGVQRITHASPSTSPLDFHAAMRALHADRRRAMEASVLKEIAETLMSSPESTA